MCGPSGAGKSTWVKQQIANAKNCIHISRDEVRFSIVKDDEDYFSHENEVFDEFIRQINEGLKNYDTVFADATHMSEKARNKTLDRLNLDGVDLYAVDFNIPVEICLDQNEKRRGVGRTYVPRSVIRRMAAQYQPPTDTEKYHYHILHACVKEG